MLLLVLALCLVGDTVPRQVPKVPEALVVLEDRTIGLPPLPMNGGQGRKQFKVIHAQIKTAQHDLTLSLQGLYGKPEATTVLGGDLSVPEASEAEGAALVAVLMDADQAKLELAFSEVWKGWQAALVESGLAKPIKVRKGKEGPSSPLFEEARKLAKDTLKAMSRQPKKRISRLDASFNVENVDLYPDVTHYMTRDEYQGDQKIEHDLYVAQNSLAVANELIPALSKTWNPLVDHLNQRARRLADLEQAATPTSDPILNALRVQTKIAFLERFRTALWYCDLVWSQVASEGTPMPPPRLMAAVIR